MLVEQVSPPSTVSDVWFEVRRAHYVREKECGEHPIGVAARTRSGEKLLDLIEEGVDPLGVSEMIGSSQLDELRPRDCCGGLA